MIPPGPPRQARGQSVLREESVTGPVPAFGSLFIVSTEAQAKTIPARGSKSCKVVLLPQACGQVILGIANQAERQGSSGSEHES